MTTQPPLVNIPNLEALAKVLPKAFITCQSGNGKPKVVLEFHKLEDAQEAHGTIINLFKAIP